MGTKVGGMKVSGHGGQVSTEVKGPRRAHLDFAS